MGQIDSAFYRPDINWASIVSGSITDVQGGALPSPLILTNGDFRTSEVAADGTVIQLRFAIGSALWEPKSGAAGTATVTDKDGSVLLAIVYDGRNLPRQLNFNPPILSTNGIRVSAPTGTIRVYVQGYSRYSA